MRNSEFERLPIHFLTNPSLYQLTPSSTALVVLTPGGQPNQNFPESLLPYLTTLAPIAIIGLYLLYRYKIKGLLEKRKGKKPKEILAPDQVKTDEALTGIEMGGKKAIEWCPRPQPFSIPGSPNPASGDKQAQFTSSHEEIPWY